VNVLEEVSHLVMCNIKPMELILKGAAQFSELGLISHVDSPTDGQVVLDLFQLPQKREDF
jgi:hypothetical protein